MNDAMGILNSMQHILPYATLSKYSHHQCKQLHNIVVHLQSYKHTIYLMVTIISGYKFSDFHDSLIWWVLILANNIYNLKF